MIRSSLTQFLIVRAGADKVRHSGRTLFDHLVGTHDLLQRWGNSEDICNAGLFHSIYGTRHFKHKAWPLTDRATIQRLIGHQAEYPAFLFCTTDRPRSLFEEIKSPAEWLVVAEDQPVRRILREIEAANLLEQGSKGRWLALLRASDISDAAKAAIDARVTSPAP
jgi:hypothetical protein